MANHADLQISLHRHLEPNHYRVEPRLRPPGSDALIEPPGREEVVTRIDLRELAVLDEVAYGQELARCLFGPPAVRTLLDQGRALAKGQDPPVLRLRLYIGPGAPEVHSIRWELLRDPADPGKLLALDETVLFSRYLTSSDERPVRPRSQAGLKALVVVANPDDLDQPPWNLAPVDVPGELERARRGLGDLPMDALCRCLDPRCAGLVADLNVQIVGQPTLNALVEHLRGGYDILYLVCHGKLFREREAAGERWLPWVWLEDEEGETDRVPGETETTSGGPEGDVRPGLINRLDQLPQLPHLVVLASCQSASQGTSSDGGALAALGPRLAEIGVPAVVAMQGDVTAQTAADFMPAFFRELRRDGQIDRAMAAARAEAIDRHRPDWWVPVLFTRLESGQLFIAEAALADAPDTGGYDLAAVRDLLLAAYIADDLRRLVFYSSNPKLRRLTQSFSSGDGLTDLIEKTIQHCLNQGLLPDLLAEVKRDNERQYARFEGRLRR